MNIIIDELYVDSEDAQKHDRMPGKERNDSVIFSHSWIRNT